MISGNIGDLAHTHSKDESKAKLDPDGFGLGVPQGLRYTAHRTTALFWHGLPRYREDCGGLTALPLFLWQYRAEVSWYHAQLQSDAESTADLGLSTVVLLPRHRTFEDIATALPRSLGIPRTALPHPSVGATAELLDIWISCLNSNVGEAGGQLSPRGKSAHQ